MTEESQLKLLDHASRRDVLSGDLTLTKHLNQNFNMVVANDHHFFEDILDDTCPSARFSKHLAIWPVILFTSVDPRLHLQAGAAAYLGH